MYGIDPFSHDLPRSFSTGTKISGEIANDINAFEIGNKYYLEFVTERLLMERGSSSILLRRIN